MDQLSAFPQYLRAVGLGTSVADLQHVPARGGFSLLEIAFKESDDWKAMWGMDGPI